MKVKTGGMPTSNPQSPTASYAAAGVDIDAANRAKQMMADAVRSTHSAAVLAGMGAFGGALALGDGVAEDLERAVGRLLGPLVLVGMGELGAEHQVEVGGLLVGEPHVGLGHRGQRGRR